MAKRNCVGFLLSAALLAGAAPVAAQPAAPQPGVARPAAAVNAKSEALVRRYLAAIHYEKLLDAMMGAIIPVMTESMGKQYPNLTDQQRSEIGIAVRDSMREDFTPKMLDRLVPIYAQAFSESELEAMVTFYEGPAGQSIMEKTPSLAPKSAQVARDLLPEMQKDVIRRLCAKVNCSATPAVAAPKPS